MDARIQAHEPEKEATKTTSSVAPRAARLFRATESPDNIVEKADVDKLLTEKGNPPEQPTNTILPYINDLIRKGA